MPFSAGKNLGLFVVILGLAACQGSEPPVISADGSFAGIVGGESRLDTKEAAYWTLVALNLKVSESRDGILLGEEASFCTGTLIEPDLILTAAHCLKPEKPRENAESSASGEVVFPQLDLRIKVKKAIPHPAYEARRQKSLSGLVVTDPQFDVGLILLEQAAPEPLQTAGLPDFRLSPGEEVMTRIYGFGAAAYANDLFETRAAGDRLEDLKMVAKTGIVSASQIRYDQTDKKGFCSGDSGGPHFVTRKRRPVVIGISSHLTELSVADADWCRKKSIAVLVSNALSWIRETSLELRETL